MPKVRGRQVGVILERDQGWGGGQAEDHENWLERGCQGVVFCVEEGLLGAF